MPAKTVYPTKCKCGGKLVLRYGGTAEKIYHIKPDGTQGELKSDETDMFWDTPILICEECGEEKVTTRLDPR